MLKPTLVALMAALVTVPVAAAGEAPAPDPAALAAALEAATLAPDRAFALERVNLAIGPAKLVVLKAVLVPALTPAGDAVEFVLLGDARLELAPSDPIETQQLDLFTGRERLREGLTEAVLVFGSPAVRAALLARPTTALAAEQTARASELLEEFRTQPYRTSLEVDPALLRQGLGEPQSELYFAGWLRTKRLGEVLFSIDPEDREQLFLGRFFPLDVSRRQERDLERRLRRQQRRGRGLGVELEDLGDFEQWLGSPLAAPDGSERPGVARFEPLHYQLDVRLDGKDLDLVARARIRLRAQLGGARTVSLALPGDLRIDSAALAGRNCFFRVGGSETLVDLGTAPARDEEIELEVTWSGRPFDRLLGKNYVLADMNGWYPRTGQEGVATYDVTLRWPSRLELVAAGDLVGEGEDGGQRWVHHRYTRPTLGYSFAVGKFKKRTSTTGAIPIDVYFDDLGTAVTLSKSEEILATLSDALAFFTERYGPPPIERLTVVTAVQDYSISWLGYVVLSSVALGDFHGLEAFLGFDDRRALIAHEVAHQWWGHRIHGATYHEAWLSEGLASYSALQYSRARLSAAEFVRSGPTSDWLLKLTAHALDGRPIANLGPLVLGPRLSSTRADDAYVRHIYLKAPIVLDMLAQEVGLETFDRMLAQYARAFDGKLLTTHDFLTAAETMTGRSWEVFARRFLYGIDLPQVLYETDVVATGDGTWELRGSARQRSDTPCRVEIVRQGESGFDIRCRPRPATFDPAESELVVPVWIEYKVPDGEVRGRGAAVVLSGATTPLHLVVDREPTLVRFDPLQQTWGQYFPSRLFPRRARYLEAHDALAEGRLEDADRLFAEAADLPYYDGPKQDRWARFATREAEEALDGRIERDRFHLALDRGELDRAQGLLHGLSNPVLEARLALLRGRIPHAWRLLKDGVEEGWLRYAEGAALAAVVARLADAPPDVQRRTRQAASRAGVDTTVLEEP